MNNLFDKVYFEDNMLCLYKDTHEDSSFTIKLGGDYMELWCIHYGGIERMEKSWSYSDPIEAYNLAMSWT